MILDRQSVVDVLIPLLKASRDAEKRMSLIAPILTEVPLKTQFIGHWQSHAQCTQELEEKIRWQGVNQEELSAMQTAPELKKRVDEEWISLSEKRLLQVATRIEEGLMKVYQEALKKEVPVDVRMMLDRHINLYEKNQASRHHFSTMA